MKGHGVNRNLSAAKPLRILLLRKAFWRTWALFSAFLALVMLKRASLTALIMLARKYIVPVKQLIHIAICSLVNGEW
jgi:hypothetical protein